MKNKIIVGIILYFTVSSFCFADREALLSNPDHENIINRVSINHSLFQKTNGPYSLINDNFICFHENKKVPVHLKWTNFANADSYKLEVYRESRGTTYSIDTFNNSHHIMIFPNARYKWRVTAKKNGEVIGEQSNFHQLYIVNPIGDHSITKFEENFENNSGKYVRVLHLKAPEIEYTDVGSQVPAESLASNDEGTSDVLDEEEPAEDLSSYESETSEVARETSSLPAPITLPDYWLKAGLGINNMNYTQDIDPDGKLEHRSTNLPNLHISAGKNFNKNHGIQLNYIFMPGELDASDSNVVIDEKYNWHNFSLEGIYRFKATTEVEEVFHMNWRPYFKYGLHYHLLPFLEVNATSKTGEIADNSIWTAGLGIGAAKLLTQKIHIDLSLRYQHPFSADSSVNEYDLDSGMIVDGLIEVGYRLSEKSSVNAFFNTLYLKTDYSSTSKTSSSKFEGTQTLFNNILGVNYGYEF